MKSYYKTKVLTTNFFKKDEDVILRAAKNPVNIYNTPPKRLSQKCHSRECGNLKVLDLGKFKMDFVGLRFASAPASAGMTIPRLLGQPQQKNVGFPKILTQYKINFISRKVNQLLQYKIPAFAGMTFYVIIFILFSLFSHNSLSKPTPAGIDTVYSFKPGTGQNQGQSSEYFPKNIFGLPDTSARYEFAATSPEQICSLGLGGEIIVGFKNYYIIDEPGPDFTIFENAFLNPVTNKIFAEPAKIAVSEDGINFIEFPFDSLTLKGCAGVTPTYGNKNPFNPDESGGDSFDIAGIGLKYIKYIKITDISSMLLNNKKHPFYDPTITGFDLDAVVGLHLAEKVVNDVRENINNDIKVYCDNGNLFIKNISNSNYSIKIFNLNGEMIYTNKNVPEDLSIPDLSNGLYLILIIQDNKVISKKIFMDR